MTAALSFHIEQWAAFAPGINTHEQWQNYFIQKASIKPEEIADVQFIPALQRRRLSPLARAAFNVAKQVMPIPPCPTIFASISGETQRTFELLSSIANNEDVSPTAFSLSVHNAIAGQFSILQNNTCPLTAVAPNAKHYLLPIAEAVAQLHEGADHIVIAYYEESLPEFYQQYSNSIEFPCAVALRLSLNKTAAAFQYQQSNEHQAENLHPLLAFIDFLAHQKPNLQIGYTGIQRQ